MSLCPLLVNEFIYFDIFLKYAHLCVCVCVCELLNVVELICLYLGDFSLFAFNIYFYFMYICVYLHLCVCVCHMNSATYGDQKIIYWDWTFHLPDVLLGTEFGNSFMNGK